MTDHIVVIGAGIQGAGVAQAAAAAGYKVTVVEKNSVGGATSNNSSKLIHGGLRYLESGQFSLVRECLLERQLLLHLAPELIQLKRFHIPVYKSTHRKAWQIRTGLALYSALSGFKRSGNFGEIPRDEWASHSPLKDEQLQSLHFYYDAQTNDQRLTQSVMYSAQNLGAELLLDAEVNAVDITDHGCAVTLHHNGREQTLEAAAVVNCSGPWVNELLSTVHPSQKSLSLELIQGSHLLIKNSAIEHYYYLESPIDGRAIFALPYQETPSCEKKLLLGTTETPFQGDPKNVAITSAEERYLIDSLRHYFPSIPITPNIDKYFSGLRVLPSANKSAFQRHRETLYQLDNNEVPRLISVAGGKLTSYRLSAKQVLKQLKRTLKHTKAIANTRELILEPIE